MARSRRRRRRLFEIHVPSYATPQRQGTYVLDVRVSLIHGMAISTERGCGRWSARTSDGARRSAAWGSSATARFRLDSANEYDLHIGVFGMEPPIRTKGATSTPTITGYRPRFTMPPGPPVVHEECPGLQTASIQMKKIGPSGSAPCHLLLQPPPCLTPSI